MPGQRGKTACIHPGIHSPNYTQIPPSTQNHGYRERRSKPPGSWPQCRSRKSSKQKGAAKGKRSSDDLKACERECMGGGLGRGWENPALKASGPSQSCRSWEVAGVTLSDPAVRVLRLMCTTGGLARREPGCGPPGTPRSLLGEHQTPLTQCPRSGQAIKPASCSALDALYADKAPRVAALETLSEGKRSGRSLVAARSPLCF